MIETWRAEKLEAEVVELLETYYEEIAYPIDPAELAHRMCVAVLPYRQINLTGRLLASEASSDAFNIQGGFLGLPIICYNDEMSTPARTTFSLAHEIAHIWLNHSDSDNPVFEAEADYFGGYLLAPHPLIINYQLNSEKIARLFGVSNQCAEFALDQAIRRYHTSAYWKPHEIKLLNGAKLPNIPRGYAPLKALQQANAERRLNAEIRRMSEWGAIDLNL